MHPEAKHRGDEHPASNSARGAGTNALWYVTRVYTLDGRPVVDIVRPGSPGAIDGVPLLLPGGTAAAYSHTPVTPSPQGRAPAVTELRQTSLVRVRVVDGRIVAEAVAWPQQDLGFVDKQPEPTAHQDHPGTPTPRDHAMVNGKGKLLLDARGEVLAASETAIRLQVGADGVFRLSRDGDGDEAPPLGFALVEYLSGLVATVNSQAAIITALSLQVSVLSGHAINPVVVPTVPPYTPSVAPSADAPSLALVSAAVQIPSDAVG